MDIEIAIVILTGVLVFVTGYYAWQTKRTVDELRRARGVAILPRLTVSAEFPGPKFMWVVLLNGGIGPALDVDLRISYKPIGFVAPWKAPVMMAGERRRLIPPDSFRNPSELGPDAEVRVIGTYNDAMGDCQQVDEAFSPKEVWDSRVEANAAREVDLMKDLKDELEGIRKALEALSRDR